MRWVILTAMKSGLQIGLRRAVVFYVLSVGDAFQTKSINVRIYLYIVYGRNLESKKMLYNVCTVQTNMER